MPADFDKWVSDGGKVVTKSLKDDKYIKICYDKDGTSHSGEVKTKKKDSSLSIKAKELVVYLRSLI